jgi:hypothetical protein
VGVKKKIEKKKSMCEKVKEKVEKKKKKCKGV